MPRQSHGRIVTPGSARAEASGSATGDLHRFDFLFHVKALQRLAAPMVDPAPADQPDPGGDSPIPAAYTYLGQFVDHDITLEPNSGSVVGDDLVPMTVAEIHSTLARCSGCSSRPRRRCARRARTTTTTCRASHATPTRTGTGPR